MLAVGLPAASLDEYLEKVNSQLPGELTVACYNSPNNHTISGDTMKIDELKRILDEKDIFARKLKVKTAYHSSHMKDVAGEYLQLLGDMEKPADAQFAADMYSSVTGNRIEGDLTSQYWVDNLISPVRFTDALLKMSSESSSKNSMRVNTSNSAIQEIVEVGPHSALRSAIKETLTSHFNDNQVIGYHAVLDRSNPGVDTLLTSVGNLFARGSVVDLSLVNQASPSHSSEQSPTMLVKLPPYAFNHSQNTWYESRLSRNYRFRKHPRHDLFGAPVPDWNPEEPVWRNFIRISEQPWLRDHVVSQQPFFAHEMLEALTEHRSQAVLSTLGKILYSDTHLNRNVEAKVSTVWAISLWLLNLRSKSHRQILSCSAFTSKIFR